MKYVAVTNQPNRFHWTFRHFLALLVIPLEFLLGWLSSTYFIPAINPAGNPAVPAVISFSLKLLSLILIIILFHHLLASDWRSFKKRLWLKLLICIAAAFVMRYVLTGMRMLMGIPQAAEALRTLTGGLPYGLFLLAAFTPVLAPVTEEVVFRHVLFYSFREKRFLYVLMCFVSAFLFGAIHYNNFGGNLLLTVPYMVVALLYNLVYHFTGNIWYTIVIHTAFNFMQSVIPALQLPFLASRLGAS